MIARASGRTATAPLLYWLLLVSGLVGVTAMRVDALSSVVPLWAGTVSGVALGQFLAWVRLRSWVIGIVVLGLAWCSPVILAILYQVFGSFGSDTQTCVLAFLPAAVCGYLSMSERGGLIAFWYPAVLWMIVILDGPSAGAMKPSTALPLVVGLTALFVAFLRARETRRSALWHEQTTVRLAEPLPRKVLRTSPLRAASQHAWTGLAGAAALVLATWVAPHLWQNEAAKHATTKTSTAPVSTEESVEEEAPCCWNSATEDAKRNRVREYFPLTHGHDREDDELRSTYMACVACRGHQRVRTASHGATGVFSAAGNRAYSYSSSTTSMPSGYDPTPGYGAAAGYGGAAGYGHAPAPSTPAPSTYEPTSASKPFKYGDTPAYVEPPAPVTPQVETPAPTPQPAVAAAPTPSPVTSPVTSPAPRPLAVVPEPAAPPADGGAPWRAALVICMGGLALHLLVRAVRRQLTLRHLARPFWRETLDQRISNQWQRMLIGLRDAGIHPTTGEQPQALARRIGIEGMSTCATILERVRHGVRVEDTDLDAMDAAAAAVYRAARERAGVAGRVASLVRSPL
jgi:hypothetical protein